MGYVFLQMKKKKTMHQIQKLEASFKLERQRLLHHPLYDKLTHPKALQIFMETHVFAVWDFMSLVKYLQRELTCVSLPWVPKGPAVARRLINEIVFGEESDIDQDGKPISHFELYVQSMEEIGANTVPIKQFVQAISTGKTIDQAISTSAVPKAAQTFIQNTMKVIESKKTHCVAGVFTFGREDLIPDMFIEIVKQMKTENKTLVYYLERHIEVDGGEHGPMALEMISELCGKSDQKWKEAQQEAQTALQQRIALWDAISDNL